MEYPERNLRVRREDKGGRFVIADGDQEDALIEVGLKNRERFAERNDSPLEEYVERIERFAADALANEEIDDKQYRFITNKQKPSKSSQQAASEIHLANPKPQYKTHKVDQEGQMVDPVPIRTITVGSGTPVHSLSKLCSVAIQHLVNTENLPRMNQSTKHCVRRIIFINENHTPISPSAAFAFSDIQAMYDNVDIEEGIAEVKTLLEKDPSPLGMSANFLTDGLKLCLECNCVQFANKFYIPCKGCGQGTCHACTFTYLWVGKIVRKHLETSNIDSLLYSIYRDDGLDVLPQGLEVQDDYQQHLDSLHPNLKWDLTCASEGGYLDLFLMLKNGRIEWKTFTKTPPLYLHKISCHDPKVFQSIPKGVGYRLRLTNSTNETFRENVELYSRAMAVSGYNYQTVKRELLKFENLDPVELAKRGPSKKKSNSKGCKVYFNAPFEPRVPHPRKILSKNYQILARNPKASSLFPRENLIASSKRLKNLGELLSPTVQGGQRLDANRGAAQGLDAPNGSYQCPYFKRSGKCDVCKHMLERRTVMSSHFGVKHAIAGHNVHPPATGKRDNLQWFIYLMECLHDDGIFQYVGSTVSVTERWANTKSKINSGKKAGTGLEKHYEQGCSKNLGPDLQNVRITLLETMTTNNTKLRAVGHEKGAGCRCEECEKLKSLEDKWICRLGSYHGQWGLNERNEITNKVRTTY